MSLSLSLSLIAVVQSLICVISQNLLYRTSGRDSVTRQRYGQHTPMALGSSLATLRFVTQPRAGSILVPRLSATVMPAVLLLFFAAFLRAVEVAQPFFTRRDVRRDGSIHTLSHKYRSQFRQPSHDRIAGFSMPFSHCRDHRR